jgi:GT2 family glycosyltransferase
MPLTKLDPGDSLGLRRGEVVVGIPVYDGWELFTQCLASVLAHTDPATPILICDDASPDPSLERFTQETMRDGGWPHRVHYLRRAVNGGFVESVNDCFAVADPADVVILNSDCIVTAGWLEGLAAAARGDERNATATALTNAGSIVSVPERNHPRAELSPELTVAAAAAAIRDASLRLRPDLPTCVGHCVYVSRRAVDLVGGFDPAFSPGYEEEADFSQRCLIHGLRHVLADDVFVYHRHAGSFGSGEEIERLRWDHHVLVSRRYPYYDAWVEEVRADRHSPLAQVITAAGAALRGVSVTIDARCLSSLAAGTAVATLELILALAAHTDLRLRVLVPDRLDDQARQALAVLPALELLAETQAGAGEVARTDVVHRPYQVTRAQDVELLGRLGDRLVLTQLDHIALRNPDYFSDYTEWRRYRQLVGASLAAADQAVFLSRHGAEEAQALQLVEPGRANVIALSVEPSLSSSQTPAAPPPGADQLADRPYLLVLGRDFRHKNRPFALRLLEALVSDGWDGALVLAGERVAAGSSAGEEAALLATRPQLARRVLDLGAVDAAAKGWWLAHAAAVAYPTVSEGFGLVPFEAAQAGVPCLFAGHTSLSDQLPADLATLVPWSAIESARRVASVLVAGPERERLISGIRTAGAQLTAVRHAHAHAEVYARALACARPAGARQAGEALGLQAERETLLDQREALQASREALEAELQSARAELGEIYDDPLNRGLAGRHAILPAELRRPVLAVASRPVLRTAATALYRAGHALRRRSGS